MLFLGFDYPRVSHGDSSHEAQNDYYHLLHAEYPARERRAAEGDPAAAEWARAFAALGGRLHVRVPALD